MWMPTPNASRWRAAAVAILPPLALIGCGSVPPASKQPVAEPSSRTAIAEPSTSSSIPVLPRAGSGRGGYYQDDGPGDNPPEGLLDTPDAEPRIEPYRPANNRPYSVFGQTYTPLIDDKPFKQRGVGSWYGKKFHGQKTASGELYDMYKMTAAHPTLPIPSYARVTNLSNGKQVIVRINDRGPFHSSRIIDLSYTAALKLGYLGSGSSELEVERLLPEDIVRLSKEKEEKLARPEQSVPSPDVLAAAAATMETPSSAEPSPVAVPANDAVALQRPAAPPATTATVAPGFYLQLGSYSQLANADAARSKLQQGGATLPPVEVVEYGLFYRLYSGPFATRAEASAAASRLQEGGAFKPLVVQR